MGRPRLTSVGQALRAERSSPTDRQVLAHALGSPFVWPVDPDLVSNARSIRDQGPSQLAIGEACLVSVSSTPNERVAALWTLTPQGGPDDGAFAGAAARSLAFVRALARRDLPVLFDRRRLESRPNWRARFVFSTGDSSNRTLDGESFQLAMCLAEYSLLLGRPMPADVVATARVDSEGTLLAVDEIATKLDIIGCSALGVRRVILSSKTADGGLEEALRRTGRDVAIVRCRTLSEAVAEVFGHSDTWLAEVGDARELVEELFTLSLEGSTTLLGWRSVAQACSLLLERPGLLDDPSSRQKAVIARQIALRHEDEPQRIDWPDDTWLQSVRRPHRVALIGHVIQSAADADLGALPSYLDRAAAWIARPPESSVDDLRALGAEGRARAASGDYEGAAVVLDMVVGEWRSLRKFHEASHPLCELLRVLGILGRVDAVDRIVALVSHLDHDPRLDPSSRAYLHLAAGRALVQVSAERRALDEFLASGLTFDWQLTSTFVLAARLRWKARAHRTLGELAAANAALRELATVRDGWEQLQLARLDAALASGSEVERAVRELLELDGPADKRSREARHIAARLAGGRSLEHAAADPAFARRVADEFRY